MIFWFLGLRNFNLQVQNLHNLSRPIEHWMSAKKNLASARDHCAIQIVQSWMARNVITIRRYVIVTDCDVLSYAFTCSPTIWRLCITIPFDVFPSISLCVSRFFSHIKCERNWYCALRGSMYVCACMSVYYLKRIGTAVILDFDTRHVSRSPVTTNIIRNFWSMSINESKRKEKPVEVNEIVPYDSLHGKKT